MSGKRAQQEEFERRMASPDFWLDKDKARETVELLKLIKSTIEPLEELSTSLEEAQVLAELVAESASAEEAEEVEAELATALEVLGQAVGRFEFQRMLSGPDDRCNAYVTIHAGAGGTESCDWTEMLLRMYLRWAERSKLKAEVMELSPGEEAGLRRVTIHITGRHAFGYLRAEIGVHRLVRISPFDTNKRRHTSFASVDVTPELEDEGDVEIADKDLRIDTYRASGAGGQHVNKTDSAVRITHLPTNIVVQCQNDRSQHKNRRIAMKMLTAKLHAVREARKQAEITAAYDAKGQIAFGYQIRSYVLQPYQMVKDLRTKVETGNVEAVLDGDIDRFIEAYLRKSIGADVS